MVQQKLRRPWPQPRLVSRGAGQRGAQCVLCSQPALFGCAGNWLGGWQPLGGGDEERWAF